MVRRQIGTVLVARRSRCPVWQTRSRGRHNRGAREATRPERSNSTYYCFVTIVSTSTHFTKYVWHQPSTYSRVKIIRSEAFRFEGFG